MVFLLVAGGLIFVVLAFWSVIFLWEGHDIKIGNRYRTISPVFGWLLLAIYLGIGCQAVWEFGQYSKEHKEEIKQQSGKDIDGQVNEIFE